MINNQQLLKNAKTKRDSAVITEGNTELLSQAIGNVDIKISINNVSDQIEAKDVLYVPNLTPNLLSVSKVVKKGNTITFSSKGCLIIDAQSNLLATATEVDGIYKLDNSKERRCISSIHRRGQI